MMALTEGGEPIGQLFNRSLVIHAHPDAPLLVGRNEMDSLKEVDLPLGGSQPEAERFRQLGE